MLSSLESDFLVPNATLLVYLILVLLVLLVIVIPVVAVIWVAVGRRAKSRNDRAASPSPH